MEQNGRDPHMVTKYILDILLNEVYPLIQRIRYKLCDGNLFHDVINQMQDVYLLCCSQIMKNIMSLLHILKMENNQQICLQETRKINFEQLIWCINRLKILEDKLKIITYSTTGFNEVECDNLNDSFLSTPMYFVNWIDHTFQHLEKLSQVIYQNDYQESEKLSEPWKENVLECVSGLHISIDELLMCAMTLCKYSLPVDQHVVKARCQVVLRETKTLISELIEDVDGTFKATKKSLKLPVKPSNVNILIDVLKDVLYVLETNTNTALLALLVSLFSMNVSPVEVLRDHFKNTVSNCSCHTKSDDALMDECLYVKEFDLYNERLLQIGLFAVSCSSDKNRVLTVRSGLATLEALDPHLVPALMLSPDGNHAQLLMNTWKNEVRDIRDSVFLIVDPAAFAEKSKQMMHQVLLEIMKQDKYNNIEICKVINIGSLVHDFLFVYSKQEPEALGHCVNLPPLLTNLYKAQVECKVVSNLLASGDDFIYDVMTTKGSKEVTMVQVLKRLKLLYTLVSRIGNLLNPKQNDDQFFDEDFVEEEPNKNMTFTIPAINGDTYVQSPKKPVNLTRSNFARASLKMSSNRFPLCKLTQHLKIKQKSELNFSAQLDELFDLSDADLNRIPVNKLDKVRERSILYNFQSKKNRSTLRKAVLSRHCKLAIEKEIDHTENCKESDKDDTISLQITEILDQMNEMTQILSTTRRVQQSGIFSSTRNLDQTQSSKKGKHISRPYLNNSSSSSYISDIHVNSNTVEVPLETSTTTDISNASPPSNVTTLERISDLDLVESKLYSLKSLHQETSL